MRKEEHLVAAKQRSAAKPTLRTFRSKHDQFLLGVVANLIDPMLVYPLPGIRMAGFNSGALFSRGLGPAGDRVVMNGVSSANQQLTTSGFNESWWNNDGSDPSHMYADIQNGATANKPILTTRYLTTRGLMERNFKLTIPAGHSSATWWVLFDPEDTDVTLAAMRVAIDGNLTDPYNEGDTAPLFMEWDNSPFSMFNTHFTNTNVIPPFKHKTPLLGRTHNTPEVEVLQMPKPSPAVHPKHVPVPPVADPPTAEANLKTETNNYIHTGGVKAKLSWVNENEFQSVAFRARSSTGSNPDSFRRPLQIANDLSALNWPTIAWLIGPTPGTSVETTYRGCAWTCMHGWETSGTFDGQTMTFMKKVAYALNQDLPFYEVTLTTNANFTGTPEVTSFNFNYTANAWFGVASTIEAVLASLPYVTPSFGPPDWMGETMLTSTVLKDRTVMRAGPSPITHAISNLEPNTPMTTAVLMHPQPLKAIAQAALPAVAANPANHVETDGKSPFDTMLKFAEGLPGVGSIIDELGNILAPILL